MQKNKIKTEWNMGLLYKSTKDPQIEKDMQLFEKTVVAFEKKYRNTDSYLNNEADLAKALADYEKIEGMSTNSKPIRYFNFLSDLDSNNQEVQARLTMLDDQSTKIVNKIIFFSLKLGKIDPQTQKQFLKSPKLKHFHYFLKIIFDRAKYKLSEPEEKILNLMSLPAYSLWVQGREKLMNSKMVEWKGKNIPLPQAHNMIRDLNNADRKLLHTRIVQTEKDIAHFAESARIKKSVYFNYFGISK